MGYHFPTGKPFGWDWEVKLISKHGGLGLMIGPGKMDQSQERAVATRTVDDARRMIMLPAKGALRGSPEVAW